MRKKEKSQLLARILRMELSGICHEYFTEEEEKEMLLDITDQQIALAEEAASLLTDEEYVLLHNLLVQLSQLKKQTGEAYREMEKSLVYRYMALVYLEYHKEMNSPEDYFLLADKKILDLYNKLADKKHRIPSQAAVMDAEGNPLYILEKNRAVAYSAAGEKLCDTLTDEKGNIGGWKKTGNYAGEFADGIRHGKGMEYYATAGCSGIRREGVWEEGQFVSGKEYGILVYLTQENEYEIKLDFDGKVLHKDLDYVWDVIMGDGESARYYFADALFTEGRYEIIKDTLRPAIV